MVRTQHARDEEKGTGHLGRQAGDGGFLPWLVPVARGTCDQVTRIPFIDTYQLFQLCKLLRFVCI